MLLYGTAIATPSGSTPIHKLTVGTEVSLETGEVAKVVHVVRRQVKPEDETLPYTVYPGAFGEQRPERPLFLSKGHKMIYEDGRTWRSPMRLYARSKPGVYPINNFPGKFVDYFHIEVEPSGPIIAEGVGVESYRLPRLKTGQRAWNHILHTIDYGDKNEPELKTDPCGCDTDEAVEIDPEQPNPHSTPPLNPPTKTTKKTTKKNSSKRSFKPTEFTVREKATIRQQIAEELKKRIREQQRREVEKMVQLRGTLEITPSQQQEMRLKKSRPV